jgi:eukaryotic-like serine/threonine-protein kinase
VPSVVNMTTKQAQARLHDAGLDLGRVTREASEDVPKGRIITQDPDPLSMLPPGGPVDVTVSTGKPDVIVPYVVGQDKDTARQELVDRGLRVKLVKQQSDEDRGLVTGTDPNPAQSVSKGTVVTVFWSAGPRQVPLVVGMTEAKARATLTARGFNVQVAHDSETVATKGEVLKQNPDAGSAQKQGSTVVITVSTYVQPSETPSTSAPPQTPEPSPTETQSATPPSASAEP